MKHTAWNNHKNKCLQVVQNFETSGNQTFVLQLLCCLPVTLHSHLSLDYSLESKSKQSKKTPHNLVKYHHSYNQLKIIQNK